MRYTINVNASLNGKNCKNPQVEFILGEDILISCEIENGQITFELPEGVNPNACIEGYIKCEDDCLNCPPQYFKVCLCNDVTALEACQICVDGFIKDICTPAELAAGKVCTPDGCKCPPTLPVTDPTTGQCVQCITGQVSGCKICVAGYWQDIVCPENEVCIGDTCTCAPGYVRNVFTGLCEPAPRCIDDSDCGVCETCVAGECKPIQCPPGFQCWNGECIPGCINTSCTNGADCGPNCGCLNGECVPCAILSCMDIASCQAALGCQCQGDNCVPVNNCGQYCDGNTPCLDANCTCYNNECVSCANFPCNPDECSDKYNCGCVDSTCAGNQGCNDKFELIKNTDCVSDGCELEAKYTTEHECLCDPIEFKIKNVYNPVSDQGLGQGSNTGTPKIMELQTKLYKNNIPYENFKSVATMGDDELVDATIRTTITHKVDGNTVNPGTATVTPVSVDGANKVPNIVININHVAKTFNGKGTVVIIEVRAENVKVNNNGCINYKSKVIATYELDYRTASTTTATTARIGSTYSNEISEKVADTTSIRKPLFVWFKSNTGNFGLNKYMNNGSYNQNGFFRKIYGVNTGDAWVDKVNNPAKQTTTLQKNELWNNLNYRVTVDCGCGGGSGATLQNVVFCCTDNIDYTIENCGKRIVVPPFNVCSVNKNLTAFNSAGYTIPQESQTYFWMVINGTKEVLLRPEGGEVINSSFTYDHDTNISSVRFEQRYKGAAIVPVSCPVEYVEDYTGPDYNVTAECGKVTVTKQPSSPTIQSVTGKKGSTTISFTPSNANTIWTATGGVLNMNGEVEVTVNFQNSCTYTKKVTITCQPEITAEPTDTFARGECPGGTNPDVVVTAVAGFSSAVKFSKDGVTYVNPDTTTPAIQKTFTNFAAGTYTFYAKEIINGVEVIDTAIVTINPMLKPTLSKTDICGNTQGSITIQGAAPTSTWKIYGPAFNGFTVSIGSNGSSSPVQIPTDKPGQYIVKLVTDPTNSMCTGDLTIDIASNGGVITPTVVKESLIVCNNGEIHFRIDDGGLNLTYNISLSNTAAGILQDLNGNTIATLQANNTGTYNAKVVGLNNGASTQIYNILITGIVGNSCYTLTGGQIQSSFSVQPGPNIGNISISCSDLCQDRCYNILVAVSGTTTGVTIGGFTATQVPGVPGVWQKTNLQTTASEVTIVATNTTNPLAICSDTVTVDLIDCSGRNQCPEQTILITDSPDSPTCGISTVSLYYSYSTIPNIDGAEYRWYKTTGGIMQLLASGTVVGTTVPQYDTTSSYSTETYVLMLVTTNGICEYISNEIDVYADSELAPVIYGAGISPDTTTLVTGQTYSYNTGFIPNGTYTWTLSNANGADQPIGTNSNAITISSFTNGPNTINLTVTNGICTGTTSVDLVVGLSCPTISLGLDGIGTTTCQNIVANIGSIPPGVTATSYTWSIDSGLGYVATAQTGLGAPQPFNTIDVEAGATVDVKVDVIFSNSCPVSAEIEFTRCACICSSANTTCGSNRLYSLNTGVTPGSTVIADIGQFASGTVFDWNLGFNGTSPIQFVFKLDGVTIHDTDLITRMASAGGCTTGSCPLSLEYLGDNPSSSVVMNVGPTSLTGTTTAIQTSGGCDRLINDVVNGFISGTGVEAITLGSDGFLTVEITTYTDTGCGSYASSAIVRLECI